MPKHFDRNNDGGWELSEEDWCTDDYQEWWQHGCRGRLQTPHDPNEGGGWGKMLKARMEKDGFWPNCWYIGERGDANILDLEKEEFQKFTSAELDAALAEYESTQEAECEFEDAVLELVYAE